VQGSAVFIVDGFTHEGQVLDLSVPGCLIDSPVSPKKGDSLTLCLDLPQVGALFCVARAVVRWVQGSRFGVEFIEMDQTERLHYNAAVANFLQHQTASHSRPEEP
jgi:hypothetical protein